MIIPIIYPSAGNFWLNSDPSLFGYSFNNRRLTGLPSDQTFSVTSKDAKFVAKLLNLDTPLYLTAPHDNFKWKGKNCIVNSHNVPFPDDGFVYMTYDNYDIYIASPELSFLQAARSLDIIDLVKYGYDLCATYYPDSSNEFGQTNREPLTTTDSIRHFLEDNHRLYGGAKSRKSLKFVRDFSNSPVETKLAMFSVFSSSYGGCEMNDLEMNPAIDLTKEGIFLTGKKQLRGDLLFCKRLVVDYNSNTAHLKPAQYTIDMNRQTAIKLAGYDYVAITNGNISSYHSLIDTMNSIRVLLGLEKLDPDNDARRALYYRLFKD